MSRKLSHIAPDWWDYTTLDHSLINDAAKLTERGPAWNALFGDANWDGAPTWEPYQRK